MDQTPTLRDLPTNLLYHASVRSSPVHFGRCPMGWTLTEDGLAELTATIPEIEQELRARLWGSALPADA